MNKNIKIENQSIAFNAPVYVIAEMSANHLGDFDRAIRLIDQIKETGADAVKLQTYTPDTITLNCNDDAFQLKEGLWDGDTLYSLYQKAYTPWEWQEDLKKHANEIGLACFSSPFDLTAVDFMQRINMPAFKIASFEVNDVPLIRKAARTGKPIIISTGIAYMEDIERALRICEEEGNQDVILLKCTSAYPCPYEDMNLKVIPNMMETFDCIVGLSDHTLGAEVALGAVALGAKVVEKHVTLRRSDGGADAAFSMEMDEFADMVCRIRNLEKALGMPTYRLTEKQKAARGGSRSLYVVEDVKEGEPFTPGNVRSIRPGNGLHTKYYDMVLKKRASRDVKKGTPLYWDIMRD